jgi:phosphate uptake regulator
METRKVQVTGGSTFTVSIPKDWATENDVEAGDRLAFYPQENSLVVSPGDTDEKSRGTIDITDLHGESLTRTVMTMYVSGFDVMVLESGRIDAEQRQAIRSATQSLVGLEVIEETGDHVVIQDLLDSSELSVHNAVTRMRLIALSMLEDAVTAICENDDSLAEDVIERDDDVDRLWFMVSRIFRATLRTPKAAEELGVPREICFDYHSSARQLERIADHAAKMAQHARELGEVPDSVAEGLRDLHADADDIVNTAMDALLKGETEGAAELANDAREQVREIDQHTRRVDDSIRDLDAQQAQLLGLVVDSLSRTADYGGNIAETALQKAAPRPEK